MELKNKTFITFGQIHSHSINDKILDKDCVAVIESETHEEGRKKAFEYFGDKFFTSYFEDQFELDSMKYFSRGFIEI